MAMRYGETREAAICCLLHARILGWFVWEHAKSHKINPTMRY